MHRLFDNVDDGNNEEIVSRSHFRKRVTTAARKIGTHYRLPHIVALQEVENLNVLTQITGQIEQGYQIRYRPVLIPGQDVSGINLAFLVRYGVEIKKVGQLFTDKIFNGKPLFSRPPLHLDVCYIGNCLSLLNLHLRSMRGIDSRDDGKRVAAKRLRQAESIASWAQRFQQSKPQDWLMILGDFNALTPSDKHVDVAGIIRGNPDNRSLRFAARDLLEPNLIDLTLRIPQPDRHSFVYRKKRQQLDYILVNQSFTADLETIAFGNIDRRFSDHAGLLAWFKW